MPTLKQDTAAYVSSLMALDKTTLPADGGTRFNRLIFARSPYLLQHAENPVDWFEWGEAAFARAQTENLPILLSIGYATCHWCHVMAHESFEDGDVATLLNRHFVCIKVDREERPDIDDFYMAVSQTVTGSGGWPLNIFMTPDKKPFMAITYLPKRGHNGMSGLMELLANIATLWRQKPDMIDNNCRSIMAALHEAQQSRGSENPPEIAAVAARALQTLKRIYDPQYGGFGSAPKFPMPIYLSWLIGYGDQSALDMALHTLRHMRSGGIWDQLGGGLHRYSVDQRWLAPHFEKMLYDQAMFTRVVTRAFQATGNSCYRSLAEDTLNFVQQELLSAEGAFYSALDADSEGVEGKFYLWSKSEIDAILGSDAELFCRFHDVTEEGNFEEHNILTAQLTLDEFCQQHRLNHNEIRGQLERCRTTLLEQRTQRIRPLRDEKIITSWNGLMISAFATAGIVFNKPEYVAQAAQTASFILRNLRRADGRLLRCYLNGASDVPAFLEDYAFLAGGMLDLFEASLDVLWLTEAQQLADNIVQLFSDPDTGEFTLTGHDAEQMPARVSSDHDGVTPSALSRTADLLYRLAWIIDRPELLENVRSALGGISGKILHNPLGHLEALQLLTKLDAEPAIAAFAGTVHSTEAQALNRVLHGFGINNLIVRCNPSSSPLSLSLCMSGTCYPHVSTTVELERLLQM